MAKKSMIERDKKRQKLILKYAAKRADLKARRKVAVDFEETLSIQSQLQDLPKNSSPSRWHNRCLVTGRPKGYFRQFGLSRHVLREMAHQGLLPGVTKSSW
jgi:small subunit ribosomal protein S14